MAAIRQHAWTFVGAGLFTPHGAWGFTIDRSAARDSLPLPDSLSFAEAAGFQIAYGTSHLALAHKARLQPGETLLVLGAAKVLPRGRVAAVVLASMAAGLPWDWVSFPEFLDSVERAPKAVNILPYVPVGPLLTWVLGQADAKAGRRPTDLASLGQVSGIGQAKLERYGAALLALIHRGDLA